MRFKTLQTTADRLSPRRVGRPGRQPWLGAFALLGVTMLGACVAPNDAEFTISGIEEHQKCLENASPLQSSSSFARVEPKGVGLFFQTDPRRASAGDSIYLHVYQPERVRAQLGEPFELADPRELRDGDHTFDTPPVVRGVALFADSCPDIPESFGVLGTVIFKELGETNDTHVIGELTGGQIISLRDKKIVARELSGEWDFKVNLKRPGQYFPNTPVEDPTGRLP